jgi:hypothetical protein
VGGERPHVAAGRYRSVLRTAKGIAAPATVNSAASDTQPAMPWSSTVSQHLAVLHAARLTTRARHGRMVLYARSPLGDELCA